MASATRSPRARTYRSGAHLRPAALIVPLAVVAITLGVLIPLSMRSLLVAGGAVGLLALIGLVAVLGADKASTVLLVMAFGFAPLTNFALPLKPFVLASVFFFAAVALKLPVLMRRKLQLPGTFMLGAVLFTVMGLVSAPVAINALVSLIYLATAVFALILIPALMVWMRPTHRQMWAMMFAFAVGSAFSTLYGFPYTYRNFGFTYHPVALAYTCMLAISFAPYLVWTKYVKSRWLVVPPIAAICAVGIWTSGSRTGIVVLGAICVLIPLLERSVRLGLLLITGIVSFLPVVFSIDASATSTSPLSRLLGGGGGAASDETRLTTIQDGLNQIQQSPIIGNGYSVEHTYVIHNIYLQVLAAEGLIGLVGLILIFIAFLTPLRRAAPPDRYLAYPALAVVLAGPFQPNMADHYLGMSVGLSLIAAVAVMNRTSGAESDESDERPVADTPSAELPRSRGW